MESEEALERFKAADDRYRAGAYLEALDILDDLDEAYPTTKSIMFARARCLFKLNRAEEAILLCDEIIDRFQYEKAEALKNRIKTEHNIDTTPVDTDLTQTFGPLRMEPDSHSDF